MPVGKCCFPFLGKYELARFSLIDVVFDKDKQMKGEREFHWLLDIGK